ncbi:MAG: protein-glutamate O-methyltransferase [Rhodobiaceae bacterium]|nr:protein-glutamate O-methyltransferase [Rhodobiaceae bacterium]
MSTAPHSVRSADIPFADKDFQVIARIAKTSFGLHLEPSKKALIQSRLTRRLRVLGLTDFGAYCALVDQGDAAERDVFISALTTNVTHFYREPHHFEQLEQDILPKLIERAKARGRVRLWSAGCSTGQEPYSLAGSIFKLCPDVARHDLRILATDIDSKVLEAAQGGSYRADECRFPSDAWRTRVFGDRKAPEGILEVHPELRKLITFRRLNLMDSWPMSGRFDAIMCRNVAIYFDKPTQARLWQRFAEQMVPGGMLFIGHSERMHGMAESHFESVGITAYQLRPHPVDPSNS